MVAKRRRRSPEEAQRQILDVAEAMLAESGPDAIRLQDIAERVGISHPTILHHFGSREALLAAVVRRAIEALESDLLAALRSPDITEAQIEDLVERVFETFHDRGHARVMAWLLLSGQVKPTETGSQIRAVAELAHQQRLIHHAGKGSRPRFEDTLFSIMLVAVVLFGDAVAGEAMSSSAGLARDQKSRKRFRTWLARLVVTHLEEH